MKPAKTVFIVDDDSSARRGLARLLRVAGYDVRTFESADQFLQDVEQLPHGCLVLDSRMPGLSGAELHGELERRGLELPLIFVTADDESETQENARELNASAFFRKPVDGAALLDAIQWALGETGEKDS